MSQAVDVHTQHTQHPAPAVSQRLKSERVEEALKATDQETEMKPNT